MNIATHIYLLATQFCETKWTKYTPIDLNYLYFTLIILALFTVKVDACYDTIDIAVILHFVKIRKAKHKWY